MSETGLQPRKPGRRLNRAGAKERGSSRTGTALNGGGWKQRKIQTLTCPSGTEVQVRRPGPEFYVRTGTAALTFSKALAEKAKQMDSGLAPNEAGQKIIEKLNDEEFAAMMVFGRQMVCEMLVSPRLVQNPRPGTDEVGPDDIGEDFWFLFAHAMEAFPGLSVTVGNREVEVSDLESFRPEPGVSGDSADGAEIRTASEQPTGGQGVVNSA